MPWTRPINAIECMIGFRIDGRAIKKGALISEFGHLVPLGVRTTCMYIYRPSDTLDSKRKCLWKTLWKMLTLLYLFGKTFESWHACKEAKKCFQYYCHAGTGLVYYAPDTVAWGFLCMFSSRAPKCLVCTGWVAPNRARWELANWLIRWFYSPTCLVWPWTPHHIGLAERL
jgi:hypothetical protein